MRTKHTCTWIVAFSLIFTIFEVILSLKLGYDYVGVFYFGFLMTPTWIVSYCVRDINAATYDYKLGAGTILFDIILFSGSIAFNFMKIQPNIEMINLIFELLYIMIMLLDTLMSYLDIAKLRRVFEEDQAEMERKREKIERIKELKQKKLEEELRRHRQVAGGSSANMANLVRVQSAIDKNKSSSSTEYDEYEDERISYERELHEDPDD